MQGVITEDMSRNTYRVRFGLWKSLVTYRSTEREVHARGTCGRRSEGAKKETNMC